MSLERFVISASYCNTTYLSARDDKETIITSTAITPLRRGLGFRNTQSRETLMETKSASFHDLAESLRSHQSKKTKELPVSLIPHSV